MGFRLGIQVGNGNFCSTADDGLGATIGNTLVIGHANNQTFLTIQAKHEYSWEVGKCCDAKF
jgi:hypothetical protein